MHLFVRVAAAVALASTGCAEAPPPVAAVPVARQCPPARALDLTGFVDDPPIAAPRLSHTVVIGGDDGAYLDPGRSVPRTEMAYVEPPPDAWGDYAVAFPGWGAGIGRGFRGWHRGGHASYAPAAAAHGSRAGAGAVHASGARGGGRTGHASGGGRSGGHGHGR